MPDAAIESPDAARRRTPDALGSAATLVVVAWSLLALSRLGGSVTQAGRPFVRFVVIGIWTWLLTAGVLWLVSRLVDRGADLSARSALAAVGRGHAPLAGWAVVLFIAAGALQLRWPGFVAGLVVAVWMPWSTATTLRERTARTGRAVAAATLAQLVWLATAGRFLADRLGHLV